MAYYSVEIFICRLCSSEELESSCIYFNIAVIQSIDCCGRYFYKFKVNFIWMRI